MMKYMGSKRAMLENGLGELLDRSVPTAKRFVDLFCGSAAVATHIASRHEVEVHAFDLQHYSKTLANSVLRRKKVADVERIWSSWYLRATAAYAGAVAPKLPPKATRADVLNARAWSEQQTNSPVTQAYGGH